jgi:superkiller protein 3
MLILAAKRAAAIALLALVAVAGCSDDKPKAKAEDALKRGLAAHVAGDNDKALDLYNEVLEGDDDNKFALYNIGLIKQSTGDAVEAEKRYREALAVDPNYTPALFNLAILQFDAGDNTEAISLYRRVIAIEPNHANAHLNLGFALKAVGQQAEGDKELAAAVKLDPALASRIPGKSTSPAPKSSPSASG